MAKCYYDGVDLINIQQEYSAANDPELIESWSTRRVGQAVVLQALMDLARYMACLKGDIKCSPTVLRERVSTGIQTVVWVLSDREREDFEYLCTLAKLDSAMVRAMARSAIQKPDILYSTLFTKHIWR